MIQTVVLVSQDGIQRPPFRFPKGGHLLQFLSCLENGLLPHGQLDPHLIMVYDPFNVLLDSVSILLRIFASIFINDIGL